MEEFITFAQSFYQWVVNLVFGEIPDNIWYTTHLDAIRGIITVVLCCLVILIALWLVVAVLRFFGRLLSLGR